MLVFNLVLFSKQKGIKTKENPKKLKKVANCLRHRRIARQRPRQNQIIQSHEGKSNFQRDHQRKKIQPVT